MRKAAAGAACLVFAALIFHRANNACAHAEEIYSNGRYNPETWIPFHRIPALNGLSIEPENVVATEALIDHLKALPPSRKPVFIFPSYTVLYAAIAQAPPQPLLWFHKNLTYRLGAPDEPMICGALQRNRVGTIVVAPYNQPGGLNAVPCLARLMAEEFVPDRDYGIYHVYRRRD